LDHVDEQKERDAKGVMQSVYSCKYCKHKLGKKSTSNFKRHLEDCAAAARAGVKPPAKPSQASMTDYVGVGKTKMEAINKALVHLVMEAGLPISFVGMTVFRSFILLILTYQSAKLLLPTVQH
jgi:hypothetical protein